MGQILNVELDVYCDGACKGNPGKGGWGVYIEVKQNWIQEKRQDTLIYELYGGEENTTNNIMEMTALIKAAEWIVLNHYNKCKVTFHIDSSYIVNCYYEKWYNKWIENNWTPEDSLYSDFKDLFFAEMKKERCFLRSARTGMIYGSRDVMVLQASGSAFQSSHTHLSYPHLRHFSILFHPQSLPSTRLTNSKSCRQLYCLFPPEAFSISSMLSSRWAPETSS